MRCSEVDEREFHERYVLGRLTDDERSQYEQHVRHCQTCRAERERVRLMVHGIRQEAHDAMKREIREQVQAARNYVRHRSWSLWARAAAVLLLVLLTPTLYYYVTHSDRASGPSKVPPPPVYEPSQPEVEPPAQEAVAPRRTPADVPPAPVQEQAPARAASAPEPARTRAVPDRVAKKAGPTQDRLMKMKVPPPSQPEAQPAQGVSPLVEGLSVAEEAASGKQGAQAFLEFGEREQPNVLTFLPDLPAYGRRDSVPSEKARRSTGPSAALAKRKAPFRYRAGDRTLTVWLETSPNQGPAPEPSVWPARFEMRVESRTERELVLLWIVPGGFPSVQPNDLILELHDERILYIRPSQGPLYRAHLDTKPIVAVRQPE